MKNKLNLSFLLVPILALVGCASVWAAILTWAPVAINGFNSFVTIAAPGSTAANVGNVILAEFNELKADVPLAEAAGAGLAAKQKVVAELQVIVNDIPAFENAATSAGNISTTDKEYIAAGAAIFDTAATIYEAEAQNAAAVPVTAEFHNIKGVCYGETVNPDGSVDAYIDCTGDPSDAMFASLDPEPQVYPTVPVAPSTPIYLVKTKHAKTGNFKRQLNALARKYNHPEKQLKLTWAEHLHIS